MRGLTSPNTLMTERFKNEIMPWIFSWEGTTYEDDPSDPGGATKYGIDQRSHKNVDIKNLTESQALDIYWSEWLHESCQHLEEPMDWVFFNCAVNLGVERAKEYLKASEGNPKKFIDLQEKKYLRIAHSRPASRKYLKGWLARTEDLRKVCQLA